MSKIRIYFNLYIRRFNSVENINRIFLVILFECLAIEKQPLVRLDPPKSLLRPGDSIQVDCSASVGAYAQLVWERQDGQNLPYNIRVSNFGKFFCFEKYWIASGSRIHVFPVGILDYSSAKLSHLSYFRKM